ncbi:hypothetical protein GGR56DRAFT_264440 [Xylariaceae sp. FL0804]|nr:hypothetical protein GGR56DRAFT_264440 [Xylariaceae sp. FL0804]
MHPRPLLSVLAALLALAPAAALAKKPANAILLSDVQSLTLRAGKQTTNRRVPAVPQLKCVSSPAVCALHAVDTMRCTNQGAGYDAEDVQWSCAANLPPELKLGSTDVACEGYASRDDPYVLRGSCAVEYRLVLTEAGERRFPDIAHNHGGGGSGSGSGSDLGAWLFGALFVAVCLWILYGAWTSAQANRGRGGGAAPRRPRNNWGGGGGGGPGFGGGGGGGGFFGAGPGDDDDDPPPPYPGQKTTSSSSYRQSRQGGQAQNQGWRPGFWTGAATGAAAGYFAGNRPSNNTRQQESRGLFGSSGSGSGSSSSSWGSGSPGAGSSGSVSSSRHESTGFGSTSRR